MKYKLLAITGLLLCTLTCFGQEVLTYEYAVKDTSHLMMDVYVPEYQNEEHACMIYCFGGGFINGARLYEYIQNLQEQYNKRGWVFISIDYRQGLKDCYDLSFAASYSIYQQAIEMAGEDVLSATNYILNNLLETPQFSINPAYIVPIGSSAGAIAVLQADYFLGNRTHNAVLLPDTFRYAGVMAFSGAILTDNGRVQYSHHAPAPTLLCHGEEDHFVEYNRITFKNLSLNGSKELVERFKKFNYPYYFRHYERMGHEVAGYYKDDFELMDEFLEKFVFRKNFLQINESYYDPSLPQIECLHIRPQEMRK